jgi:hypothetical protein
VLDFCNGHGTKWQPLKLGGPTGKEPCYHNGTKPLPTDFTSNPLSEEKIRRRQSLVNDPAYTHTATDTTAVNQVDVDSPDYTYEEVRELTETAPYYLSCKKQLPHVFVKPSNRLPNKRNTFDNGRPEVLSGQRAYRPKGAVLQNDGDTPTVDLSFAVVPEGEPKARVTREKVVKLAARRPF